MKYQNVINYVNSEPWAILPEKLDAILGLLEMRAAGLTFTAAEIRDRIGPQTEASEELELLAVAGARRRLRGRPEAIGVLRVHGTIANRMNMMTETSGGTSVERLRKGFRSAIANPDIGSVILDIDSPGGATGGTEELAAEIREARAVKPIVAVVDSLAASAAFWLASGANEIVASPSSHVGSVGVLAVHTDSTAKKEADGVKTSIISAGKFKAELDGELTSDAEAHMQSLVDDRFEAFVSDLAAGRGVSMKTVRSDFGQGRIFPAKRALAAGMVDRVDTMQATIERLAGGKAVRRRPMAATVEERNLVAARLELLDVG